MSTSPFDDENGRFIVLANDEGQYSLWPAAKTIPLGWTRVGPEGRRADCLSFIRDRWINMTPRSIAAQVERDK